MIKIVLLKHKKRLKKLKIKKSKLEKKKIYKNVIQILKTLRISR